MNKDIESIVSEAMKKSAFMQFSKLQTEKDCNGQLECLVNRHSDTKKARNEIHGLAATFNSRADYDKAIKSLDDALKDYHEKNILGSAIKQFVESDHPADADNSVRDIMMPMILTTKRFELVFMATAYACLNLQWDNAAKYFPKMDIEKCPADSLIGIQIASALDAMQINGTLEKWSQLSAQETYEDKRLDYIKRTFQPKLK